MIPGSTAPTIDEQARRRFNAGWLAGRPEPIEACLPPCDDSRYRATLEELVLIDLKCWWQRHGQGDPSGSAWHDPALVEGYLERFPALNEPAVVLRLLREEFVARHRHGDRPRADEYRLRFPDLVITGQEVETFALPKNPPADEPLSPVRLSESELKTPPTGIPPASGSGSPGQHLPQRYQVLGEIARGGMGTILRGRDVNLGRDIAIKVLLETHQDEPELLGRFIEEAQIGGQLQHPGIVPIYEVGRSGDQRPYFTMKLVKGKTLAALLRESPASEPKSLPRADTDGGALTPLRAPDDLPRLLSIFEQVCQTVAYAHARRVIHRDLKPVNIMVGSFGEVQVMDWGLAKVLSRAEKTSALRGTGSAAADSTVICAGLRRDQLPAGVTNANTEPGSILGTPAYMAPEQARGEVENLDARCDVFGLGAILCQILTGQPPYTGPNSYDVLVQAAQAQLDEGQRRLKECGADSELIDLAQRCLQPRRENRPRDAGEVAAAMSSYLQSVQQKLRQVEVQRASAEARAGEEKKRRLAERQKRRMTLALAAALLVLVGGGSVVGLWLEAEQARHDADNSHRQTEAAAALTTGEKVRQELHTLLADPGKVSGLLSNLDRWEKMLDTAQAAKERAAALAGTEPLAAELTSRLEELSQQLAADQKDFLLAKALDEIRLAASTPIDGRFNPEAAGPKYSKALTRHGLDMAAGEPAALAGQIGQMPLRFVLVATLDHWAHVTKDQALQSRLLDVARLADPDPWRAQVRTPSNWKDKAKLTELAEYADLAGQSPQLVLLLAWRLHALKEPPIPLLRKALLHHPGDFWLNYDMGRLTKNAAERVGCYQAALAVRPHSPLAVNSMGWALELQGNLSAALDWYKKALALDPNFATAHNSVADVLAIQGDPAGAEYHFRKAIKLDPTVAIYYSNLGMLLKEEGKFAEALELCTKAHDMGTKQGNWPYASIQWVNHCTTLIEIEKILPAFLDGKEQSKDVRTVLHVGQVCYYKKLPAAAVRFYEDAFNLDNTKAKSGHGYLAACAAVLVASGQAKDAGPLNKEDKVKLRTQALSWLTMSLEGQRHRAKTDPSAKLDIHHQLAHWLGDAALASVRDPALAQLPEPERQAWQDLWAELNKTIKELL
jgi:serine/threonine-protein kinase